MGIATLSFLVYLSTMSRSIPYIDGGELTTVLWTLGIAHPTGYPLFTLLGHLFVQIPFSSEVAVRANLFAAVCTAAAGAIFYFVFVKALLVLRVFDSANSSNNSSRERKKRKLQRVDEPEEIPVEVLKIRLAAVLASLSLIFSQTFWEQSTSIEVYPLQLVLFALILVMWLRFHESPAPSRSFFSGLVLGLGFTNHMTTILTVPALIFLFVSSYRQKKFDLKLIYRIIAGGALAGLLYLYLPIRSSQNPILDWGNPDNFQRLAWLVSGKQFRVWMFSSFDVFQKQLGVFFSSIYSEFRITILVVVLGAAISLFSVKLLGSMRKYFWFCLLLLLGDILYAANYNIHDISSYFLLAYISLGLFAAAGFRWTIEMLHRHSKNVVALAAILLIFPIFTAFANFGSVNESNDYSVEKYTKDILSSVPHNSLVLSYQWDDFVSASLYYQNVDEIRKDVIVIDKELLRRSWYAAQIHKRFSSLFPKDDPIYKSYQANLRLFENNLPYDPNSIELSYSNFIREIITGAILDGREAFVGPEIEDQYLRGFNKVPFGLVFELRPDTTYVPCNISGLNGFHAAQIVDTDYSHQIINFYERMFLARAEYEYLHKKFNLTMDCIDKALEVNPASQVAQGAKVKVMRELKNK
jgi:hypothetical protein